MDSIDALSVFSLGRTGHAPTAKQAGESFEGYLLGQMLSEGTKPMFPEGLLDGGSAGKMYRDLFYQEVARIAARRGAFGLTNVIEAAAERADTPETDGEESR